MGFKLANVGGRSALVDGEHYFDVATISDGALPNDPMLTLACSAELIALAETLAGRAPTGALADVVLGPPVPQPQKSFAIGLNYIDHAAEGAMEVPANPLVFTKFPSCLTGPHADVEMRSNFCDYEGELVVVIGRGGKDIPAERAWDHVVGVMVGQDISDRKAQFAAKPPHFDLGKSFDTFGPTGPMLVSLDGIGDPRDLRIVTSVNGETRQDDTAGNMVFDVPTLIAYLSQITTLVSGDLIFTGTPAGIGAAHGKFLADGDVITTTIDGVGTLVNRCVRVSDHTSPGDSIVSAS
jgi:2-keto-4-pentenoate hydratase/2-oxohepta-3-ene-1,7-dioic acid hydratase in catechol pathway